MTAVGYRPFPQAPEVQAVLAGLAPRFARPPPGPLGELPVLVTADWCPYTVPVTRFWREAARAASVPIRVLDAESEEGGHIMDAARVAGVPCAIAGPGRLLYGYEPTPLEAQQFLRGARAT